MATIFKLSFAARKPAPRRDGATAEIILFPGVRYERHVEAAKPKKKRKASTKARARVTG